RVPETRAPRRRPSPRRRSRWTRPGRRTSRRLPGSPGRCPPPDGTAWQLALRRAPRRVPRLSCAACASRAGTVRPTGSRRRSPSRPVGPLPRPPRRHPPRCRRRPPPGPCPSAAPTTCSGAGCSAHAEGPLAC
ncbi:unnamed protein product, partial [Ixodes hexagonus]